MEIDTTRKCPHCDTQMDTWDGPPETGWGTILVCNNEKCPFFDASNDTVTSFNPESKIGFRYAEDPANGYTALNLACYCGDSYMDACRRK